MDESVLSSLAEHLEWRYLQFRYRVNSGRVTRSVGTIGSEFHVDSFREYLRIVDYQNEDFVIECLLEAIDTGDVFWDIGANIGTHSCYVGQKAGQTVAIEPFPANARQARRNCDLNGINSTVLEFALGEEGGKANLAVPDTDETAAGVGTFSLRNGSSYSESVTVDVIPGDKLVEERGLPLPDVMKIDVEGGELSVLRGFHNGLQNARVVLVEVHPWHVEQEGVTDLLQSAGFSVTVLRQRNDEIHLLATADES